MQSPYQEVTDVLQKVWKGRNLKSLIYRDSKLIVKKKTYAILSNLLQQQSLLDQILTRVPIASRNKALLYILTYELLLSPNKSIKGGGSLKRKLLKQKNRLQSVLEDLQPEASAPLVRFPRYVRINTIKATPKEVVDTIKSLNIPIYADAHVPNLLVLPPDATAALQTNTRLQHKIVLQDKSSCFSGLCFTGFDGAVLDACAAPGNKTSHVASLVPTHVVVALDRDRQRCAVLQSRMQQLAPDVQVRHQDFLKTQPAEYPQIRGILLDPSCSGSGMYQQQHTTTDTARQTKLANLQVTMLKHAMSFGSVEYIVYSTCSLHDTENEDVIAQALQNEDWEIVAPPPLQSWTRRGHPHDTVPTDRMIRAQREDETNGFFVCCLARKGSRAVASKSSKIPLPNAHLDLFVYNGEFAAAEEASTDEEQPKDNDPVVPTDASTQKPVLSKKRQRKLEWKRKQLNKKRQRLKQSNKP